MKFTPSSTARRKTAIASARSRGSPQTPLPVMRIAPKPSLYTGSSPARKTVPLLAAGETSAAQGGGLDEEVAMHTVNPRRRRGVPPPCVGAPLLLRLAHRGDGIRLVRSFIG